MEALEVPRAQLRESSTWLDTVRGRLVALDLVSRPRGGVTAFLKHKRVELRVGAALEAAAACAAEGDCRAHRAAQRQLQAMKEAAVYLSYMRQVREDPTLGRGPERERWRPETQAR
jgi:hypothetical protein